jgi:hypothetical protein
VSLGNVFWVGGPPGSGKTSIARALAKKHDLRVYNSDSHTWEHHFRALDAGFAATERWEAATPDERWLRDPVELAEWSLELNADRCRLILEDLDALPPEPATIVEGTPLLPWLVAGRVASPEHAVWLVPTPEFERARLAERAVVGFSETSDPSRARENRTRREQLVGEAIARDADCRGLPILRVDETRDLEAMIAAVEQHFGAALASAPSAGGADRRAIRRDDNRTILRQIRLWLAAEPAAGDPDTFEFDFNCECERSACAHTVTLSLAEYERRELVSHPEHTEGPA